MVFYTVDDVNQFLKTLKHVMNGKTHKLSLKQLTLVQPKGVVATPLTVFPVALKR